MTETKHGYWIETYYEDILMHSTCSECGEEIANTEYNRDWQYCPYCGTRMDKPTEERDIK